jgi:predicted nucleotidyltransferase
MIQAELERVVQTIRPVLAGHPSLALLVLHGSRARGDEHAGSDWDFAYLGDGALDVGLLFADLALALGTDHVDLADLATAGGLLRYRVARDGALVHESQPGAYERFWMDAVSFWCDAGPIIERGYEAVLAGIAR